LADLQLRLQFPPQVIEAMIGKVEFTAAEPGPCLPDPRACIETDGPTTARTDERQGRERQGRERQSPGRQDGLRGPKLPLTKG
jgi:hypothetical protein